MTSKSGQLTPIEPSDGYIVDERGNRYVTMSNGLIRASHGLTLGEKRLIALAITKLSFRAGAPAGGIVTRVTALEFTETFGIDSATAYAQLRDAASNLYKRSILFYTPAYRRNGKALAIENRMRWVGRATYAKGEGWIELDWWHQVLPHLTGLAKQFTRYQLEQASALRSVYSWKLLELLMRFKGSGWATYTIEDFCSSMGSTKSMEANFAKIRTKIIEPAVKELTTKDGWEIEWQAVKVGRKVKALKFQFRRDPQGRLGL